MTLEDKPDLWTEAIAEAHPMLTGTHKEYAVAESMVHNRVSKYALVDLTHWLLVRAAKAEKERDDALFEADRLKLQVAIGKYSLGPEAEARALVTERDNASEVAERLRSALRSAEEENERLRTALNDRTTVLSEERARASEDMKRAYQRGADEMQAMAAAIVDTERTLRSLGDVGSQMSLCYDLAKAIRALPLGTRND